MKHRKIVGTLSYRSPKTLEVVKNMLLFKTKKPRRNSNARKALLHKDIAPLF